VPDCSGVAERDGDAAAMDLGQQLDLWTTASAGRGRNEGKLFLEDADAYGHCGGLDVVDVVEVNDVVEVIAVAVTTCGAIGGSR
jgi:hypothetical protein